MMISEPEHKQKRFLEKSERLFVAGVGSSAGGIEALMVLLQNLPDNNLPLAIIVAQHLNPRFESRIVELLNSRSTWPVFQLESGFNLKKGNVYIIPPGFDVQWSGQKIDLKLTNHKKRPKPSVDQLFNAIAEYYQEYSIGIVLSGSGSDGSNGVRMINKQWGEIIVQEPDSALHDSMPKAAIKACDKAIVLPLHQIGKYLLSYLSGEAGLRKRERMSRESVLQDSYAKKFNLKKGREISEYLRLKSQERATSEGFADREEYITKVKDDPRELEALFSSCGGAYGISVNPDLLQTYRKMIIQALLDTGKDSIRVWIIGSSTGELAYLLAIMICGILKEKNLPLKMQIFATEEDEDKLEFSRQGFFPYPVFSGLDSELCQEFLTVNDSLAEVSKTIRKQMMFSRHLLGVDPTLVKMDLIFAFGLLPKTDRKGLILNLHYGLNRNGLVFLNPQEDTSDFREFFKSYLPDYKVFQKLENRKILQLRYERLIQKRKFNDTQDPSDSQELISQAKDSYFNLNARALVLVNEQLEIEESQGDLNPYFLIPDGIASKLVLNLIHPELQKYLHSLIIKVRKVMKPIRTNRIQFKDRLLYLALIPTGNYFALIFELEKSVRAGGAIQNGTGKIAMSALEQELAIAREELDTFSEELETSNDELQKLNEELHHKNIQLVQSNQDLSVFNEELQSANEELETTISELKMANQELIEKEAELIRSRERIRESESLYRSLARNFPNGIIVIADENYRISFVEGKGLEDLGSNKEELAGENLDKLFPYNDLSIIYSALKRTLYGEKLSINFEFRQKHFTLSTIPLYDQQLQVKQVMFVTQDISENKQLEISLKKMIEQNQVLLERERIALSRVETQQKILHRLFMQAPAAICMLRGSNHVFELVNPLFQHFFEHRELIGKPLKEVFADLLDQSHFNIIEEVYRTGNPYIGKEFPLRIRKETPAGVSREFFNIIYQAIRDENGSIDGVIIYAYEVSDLVKARKISEENVMKLQLVLESIPQVAWTAGAEGAFDYFNQRWHDLTGKSFEDSQNWLWINAVHADDRDKAINQWRQCIDQKQNYETELRFFNSTENSYRWHIVRTVPVKNDQGEVIQWVGTGTDIDDQKRLEEKKDEFLSIASHELKTPLTSVKAYVQLMEEFKEKDSDSRFQLYLSKANQGVNRLNDLITDLLDISKIQAGKIEFNFRDFDFDLLAQECVENNQITTQQHKIQIQGATGIKYYGDRERLEQVFNNLLSNAIKYSPRADKIIVNLEADENEIRVSFTDFGIGIGQGQVNKLFNRFYRGKEHQKTTPGLGIGLYISSEIINRHGGKVGVKSEIGKGSVFFFSLPLAIPNQ